MIENKTIKEQEYSRSSFTDIMFNNRCVTLSPVQKEVYDLPLEGITTAEIAKRRSCSEKAVKSVLSYLYKKFEVKNRIELIGKTLTQTKAEAAMNE